MSQAVSVDYSIVAGADGAARKGPPSGKFDLKSPLGAKAKSIEEIRKAKSSPSPGVKGRK
jgi:hypothetical protein